MESKHTEADPPEGRRSDILNMSNPFNNVLKTIVLESFYRIFKSKYWPGGPKAPNILMQLTLLTKEENSTIKILS